MLINDYFVYYQSVTRLLQILNVKNIKSMTLCAEALF